MEDIHPPKHSESWAILAGRVATLMERAQMAKDEYGYSEDPERSKNRLDAIVAQAAVAHSVLLLELLASTRLPISYYGESRATTEGAYRILTARSFLIYESPLSPRSRDILSEFATMLDTDDPAAIRETVEAAGGGWILDSYEAWLGTSTELGEDDGATDYALTQMALGVLTEQR